MMMVNEALGVGVRLPWRKYRLDWVVEPQLSSSAGSMSSA